ERKTEQSNPVARGVTSRFTFDAAYDWVPIWSPDGRHIAFASNREGNFNLYLKVSSGSSQEELLFKSSTLKTPDDWSIGGKFILFENLEPKTNKLDLWVLPMLGNRQPVPFLQTQFDKRQAQFSPDGLWVAYRTNESGRDEVYVQSFPVPSVKRKISTNGGT